MDRFKCVRCEKEVKEIYMVTDHLWRVARLGRRENMHLKCLEARLGKKLGPKDFILVPVNLWNKQVMERCPMVHASLETVTLPIRARKFFRKLKQRKECER